MSSNYLKQCSNIGNLALGNTFQRYLNQNKTISIQENAFENDHQPEEFGNTNLDMFEGYDYSFSTSSRWSDIINKCRWNFVNGCAAYKVSRFCLYVKLFSFSHNCFRLQLIMLITTWPFSLTSNHFRSHIMVSVYVSFSIRLWTIHSWLVALFTREQVVYTQKLVYIWSFLCLHISHFVYV